MDLWTWEREAWADGAAVVCGVDEAGAGPWRDRYMPPQSFCRGKQISQASTTPRS